MIEPRADPHPAAPEPPAETFEAAFQELQGVIEQLEDGGLGLEAAVRLFERGMELAQRCEAIVRNAELRVSRLVLDGTQRADDLLADAEAF